MRVTSHAHLTIATIILAFALTCYGASVSEPNKPSAEKASPREVSSHAQNDSDAIRAAKAELSRDYYKDCVDNLKWALGIMITLVVVFTATITGYMIFRNTREYRQALIELKEALSQARQAGKEARDASDKARDWEEKAREKLVSIDEKVETKLKEIEQRSDNKVKQIEAKGKMSITDLTQEGEKQRKVSREQAEKQQKIGELFNKYLSSFQSKNFALAVDYCEQAAEIDPRNTLVLNSWGISLSELARRKENAEAYQLRVVACQKFENAVANKPDYYLAWNNWGTALAEQAKTKLGDEADGLFKQAYEKYEKSVQIKEDYDEAWNSWGGALLYQAAKKRGEERRRLRGEAKQKCLKAESIKTGSGAYNLACVYALLGKEKECEKWLKTGEKAGTLVTRENAMADADLKSVRNKNWFKQIRWKGE